MNNVRYRHDTGFEMRCPDCVQYWPLDEEFWPISSGNLARCRACHLERRAIYEKRKYAALHGRYRSPEARARRRERDRIRHAEKRADPETRPAVLERQRRAGRAYYEAHRLEILEKRRAAATAKRGGPPRPGFGRPRMYDTEAA